MFTAAFRKGHRHICSVREWQQEAFHNECCVSLHMPAINANCYVLYLHFAGCDTRAHLWEHFLVMPWVMFRHRELNSFSGAKLLQMHSATLSTFSSGIDRCGSKLTTLCNTSICNFMGIDIIDNKVDSFCWCWWTFLGNYIASLLFLWCSLPKFFSGSIKLAFFTHGLLYFSGKKVACLCNYS